MFMDYSKIGFKAGLEIHQQLDTGKLFCNCPGYLRTDEPHFIVKRKLHKVAGETGEVDVAVQHESAIDREFIYQGYNDSTCLVELDEEPPKMINSNALDEALKIAL
jgi:glutamyl-tRNA(Gln) amidotransferase subunit E